MSNKFIEENTTEQVEDEILLDEDFMPKLSEEYRKKLVSQKNRWLKKQSAYSPTVTDEQLRDALISDLSFLCNMSSEEYTLHRKFKEIHREYPSHRHALLEDTPDYHELEILKNNIWMPEGFEDYKKLKPRVIFTECDPRTSNNDVMKAIKNYFPNTVAEWNALRTFLSTMINNSNIGRNLYFIIDDEITGKYLGVMAMSSDFLDLTPRDNYIGWSRELKTQGRMINHTGIGSTIVPTQPLGFNYVGGKLIALLTVSNIVEKAWNDTYNREAMPSKLVGITTTALYSSLSQYTGLKYWNHIGHSAGSIKFEPKEETLDLVKEWLSKNKDEELRVKFWEWYIATEPQGMPLKRDYKQRSLSFVYNKLGIDKKYYETNHSRGIYFCPLFTNTKEYLKQEITEDKLVRRFDNSVEALVELWREKYASKRIEKLISEKRENLKETLFYDDIINMSWNEVRDKYLNQVGR
jgi:hypothetical protein